MENKGTALEKYIAYERGGDELLEAAAAEDEDFGYIRLLKIGEDLSEAFVGDVGIVIEALIHSLCENLIKTMKEEVAIEDAADTACKVIREAFIDKCKKRLLEENV